MKLFSSKAYGFKRDIYRGKGQGELYLTRYYLLESKWLDIYIHQFHISDYPVPHDHPWSFISIPLKTGYIEHFADRTSIIRRPFCPKFRQAEAFHWVEKIEGMPSPWTLFISFRRHRHWGFLTDKGWVHHEKYIESLERGEDA